MTPKEKAKELIHNYIKELLSAKYSINGFVINNLAKECALISIDEIISAMKYEGLICGFWQEVKKEIEKI